MKTILYVEDNEFNRNIVRHLLGRTSYHLLEVNDGEAGVTTARETRPDLVIMDIQLTSFALAGEKARLAGAAYLAKPYSPRELLQMIRQLAPES